MKNFILLVIVVAAAYFGYVTWQKHIGVASQPGAESGTQPAEQNNPVAVTPNTTATADSGSGATPQAQQHILAPKGIYFLLERVSVTTDSGIFSAPVGTKVIEISTTASGMRVTDGQHQFNITPAQVTNDMTLADQLANSDHATQARLKASLAQQAKNQLARETAQIKQSASQPTLQQPAPVSQQATQTQPVDALHKTFNKKHAIPIRNIAGKIIGYNWVEE